MLYAIIVVIHIIVAVELILVVLVQKTRQGGGLGGIIGGYSQTLFGTQRTDILTKITTISAIVFMITSFLLTFVKFENKSIIKDFNPAKSQINIPQPAQQQTQGNNMLSDTNLTEVKDSSVFVPTGRQPSQEEQKQPVDDGERN